MNEPIWLQKILKFDSSVIFINLDKFTEWKKDSQSQQNLEEREEKARKADKLRRKDNEGNRRKRLSHNSHNSFRSLMDIYTGIRPYEDMAIFLTNKFKRYQKRAAKDAKMTLISPFNSEVEYLSEKLESNGIEVLTIDKSQGIDRDFVTVLCTTRGLKTNDLLQNWRRVNVACTRAKSKLLIVGSETALSNIKVMKEFIELIKNNGWMFDFESEELEGHCNEYATGF